jgi:hypothetical protein
MRSLVFFGLLLSGTVALAASCKQPSTPDIPVDAPGHDRAENKLNRAVARCIRDSAGYIDRLSADDGVDPSTVAANIDVLLRLRNAEVAADQSPE